MSTLLWITDAVTVRRSRSLSQSLDEVELVWLHFHGNDSHASGDQESINLPQRMSGIYTRMAILSKSKTLDNHLHN